MRAKELWRFAPRMHTRAERQAGPMAPSELIPLELQAKMVAAFERARAERFAEQIPEDEARWASDPSTRWKTAAFLVLERERRVVAERLSRRYRRRADRFRDLILVTRLIHEEYDHLAGRVNGTPHSPSPSNGLPVNGETATDWARPWGSGPMVEMDTALSFYEDQRDQLARRMSVPSRAMAAAAAAAQRDRILNRFEMVKGGQLGKEPLSAPQSERRGAWPWSSRFVRSATAVACAGAAIAVGAILGESGGSSSLASNPTPVVASVPDGVLAERSGQQPAGSAEKATQDNGADQVPVTAPAPTPAPKPVSEPPPAPIAPTPVAAPTPAPPPPPAPEPDPQPQSNPTSGPGPVSSLPPPVDSLPPPKSPGSG